MAFKEVADLDCNETTALGGVNKKTNKKNPTSITGYYIGSREVDSPKSKTGKAKLHIFQAASGNIGVWGKTDLDKKMQEATPGAMTRVSFTGMQQTKNNPMYKFKVEIDLEDTIDVGYGSGNGANQEEYGDVDGPDAGAPDYSDDSDDSSLDDVADDVPPPPRAKAPPVPAKAPSADSRAKVEALLNRNRKIS